MSQLFSGSSQLHISHVEHQIIHYITFLSFSWGRTNLWKLIVVEMDGGDSPHSSSAKIKLIASAVS